MSRTFVHDAGVQFDCDSRSNAMAEETGRIARRCVTILHFGLFRVASEKKNAVLKDIFFWWRYRRKLAAEVTRDFAFLGILRVPRLPL